MSKYMAVAVFIVGMAGYSLDAFAGAVPCNVETLDCDVTIKCVCEGLFSTRVVKCPTFDLPEGFEEGDVKGTLEADCGPDNHLFCEDLDIKCGTFEKPNCLVTLPVEVDCED